MFHPSVSQATRHDARGVAADPHAIATACGDYSVLRAGYGSIRATLPRTRASLFVASKNPKRSSKVSSSKGAALELMIAGRVQSMPSMISPRNQARRSVSSIQTSIRLAVATSL